VAAGESLRLAWCREFNAGEGEGVLVDLATNSEFVVRRAQLRLSEDLLKEAGERQVAEERRCLYRGEFVEYELEYSAAGNEDGRVSSASVCRVQGIHGWPLMFEAAHLFELEAGARAPGASGGG
jgi:hypothetical protein